MYSTIKLNWNQIKTLINNYLSVGPQYTCLIPGQGKLSPSPYQHFQVQPQIRSTKDLRPSNMALEKLTFTLW